jgi:Lrp/AsnC family leucine-responsive transcriptional regulator
MGKNLKGKALDNLNCSILQQLEQNARLTTTEIGRRVGLSAPAVAERIQKMEEKGVIDGYQTLINFDEIGLTIRAFISFKATNVKHPEMIKMVEAIPEVVEWFTVTGNYSLLLKVATSSSERLANIIEHLEAYGETNTSLILAKNRAQKIVTSTVR